jgi:hypothetical protein
VPEEWIVERVSTLASAPELIDDAFEIARERCQADLKPQHDALSLTRRALEENQAQVDKLVETITSGNASGALLAILNEKAYELKAERERCVRSSAS